MLCQLEQGILVREQNVASDKNKRVGSRENRRLKAEMEKELKFGSQESFPYFPVFLATKQDRSHYARMTAVRSHWVQSGQSCRVPEVSTKCWQCPTFENCR